MQESFNTENYDDIFNKKTPHKSTYHKANATYQFYEGYLRPGVKETLRITLEKAKPKAKATPSSKQPNKSFLETAITKIRGESLHRQSRTTSQHPPQLNITTPTNKPQKRELTPKQAEQIYQRFMEHDHQRNSYMKEQQMLKSLEETEQRLFQPTISNKSRQLAELKFEKMKHDEKDQNAHLLNFKSQQVQTEENCTDLIKQYHSKQAKKSDKQKNNAKKKSHIPNSPSLKLDSVKASKSKEPAETKDMEIQTDRVLNDVPVTPTRQHVRSPMSAQSGHKGKSSYIPLHERYQYILETKKSNLKVLQDKIEASLPTQNQRKHDPAGEDEPFEEKLQNFLDTQTDWVHKKQERIMKERVKKISEQDSFDGKPLLNKKSERLVRKLYPDSFEERQHSYIERKTQKIEMLSQEQINTHYPVIAPKSRQICDQASERLLRYHESQ